MRLTRSASLPEVVVIDTPLFEDDRGWFMESFSAQRFDDALRELGLPPAGGFVQDNHSSSKRAVLRGLHYQLPPCAQGKLVRVLRGAIWDVAVDIRRDSATFGRWTAERLSDDNRRQLWVPPGFAHGFIALDDDTEVLYKVTTAYAPQFERGIAWNDPRLQIDWPLGSMQPRLSSKDAAAPTLSSADVF